MKKRGAEAGMDKESDLKAETVKKLEQEKNREQDTRVPMTGDMASGIQPPADGRDTLMSGADVAVPAARPDPHSASKRRDTLMQSSPSVAPAAFPSTPVAAN